MRIIQSGVENVHCEVAVAVDAARAFETFTAEIHRWWPRQYTWSREVLVSMSIEPGLNGLCIETGPHGFRCDWGRVLAWEPPHRLQIAWQIGPRREPEPNPGRASVVDVEFIDSPHGHARVVLRHLEFERHGDGARAYRAAMAAPQGWPYILQCLAAATL